MLHRKGDNLGDTKPCATSPNPFTDVENSHIRDEGGWEAKLCSRKEGCGGCVLLLSATRFNPPFAQTALASRSYVTLCSSSDRECGQIPVLTQINCMQFVWEEYSHNFMGFLPEYQNYVLNQFAKPWYSELVKTNERIKSSHQNINYFTVVQYISPGFVKIGYPFQLTKLCVENHSNKGPRLYVKHVKYAFKNNQAWYGYYVGFINCRTQLSGGRCLLFIT